AGREVAEREAAIGTGGRIRRSAVGDRVDLHAFHAGAAAHDAAGDLNARIERDFDGTLVGRDVLRANRLRGEALALDQDVVLSLLEPDAECAVAGGGDVLVAALIRAGNDHAADLPAERVALRLRGVDGDAGDRLAALVGHAAAERDAARDHQRYAALSLAGS